MPTVITVELNDNGTLGIENFDAAREWCQKHGCELSITIRYVAGEVDALIMVPGKGVRERHDRPDIE